MPEKKLTESQQWEVIDIVEENLEGDDFRIMSDVIDQMNYFFSKIYGYKRTGRPKSRARGSRANPKKRTLSAWNKFVKANSNKKKFQFAGGKLKLKKMGIAYRKTRAYKQNKQKRR